MKNFSCQDVEKEAKETSKPGIQKNFAGHPSYQVAYMPRSYNCNFYIKFTTTLLQQLGERTNNKDKQNTTFPHHTTFKPASYKGDEDFRMNFSFFKLVWRHKTVTGII